MLQDVGLNWGGLTMSAGGSGHHSGGRVARELHGVVLGVDCSGIDLRVRVVIRVVVGAAGMADSQ